jgi:hypothetical protein
MESPIDVPKKLWCSDRSSVSHIVPEERHEISHFMAHDRFAGTFLIMGMQNCPKVLSFRRDV